MRTLSELRGPKHCFLQSVKNVLCVWRLAAQTVTCKKHKNTHQKICSDIVSLIVWRAACRQLEDLVSLSHSPLRSAHKISLINRGAKSATGANPEARNKLRQKTQAKRIKTEKRKQSKTAASFSEERSETKVAMAAGVLAGILMGILARRRRLFARFCLLVLIMSGEQINLHSTKRRGCTRYYFFELNKTWVPLI